MEFRETLLAAQRNQHQQSSSKSFYKARFDPPKKEQKQKDKLSANILKFLAKKDEEEKQKKLEAQRKREELLAMRDPKALRKIQKTLKVIKSANKSVLADAVDHDNTAVTREGPDQPDQDDYGYESQEAAAIYEKMMQKYSKIPDQPKFPVGNSSVKKDLKGTMERVKHALQHEEEPVPHKRRRKGGTGEKEDSPTRYEPEKEKKKEESKSDKPKFRKPAPPPMDFNQLLKLAEQKKSEPIEVGAKKVVSESEPERPMTKRQRREYEEEMARRQRRQERLDAEKGGKRVTKEDKSERERKLETSGIGRIPKIGDKNSNNIRNDTPKLADRDKMTSERDRVQRDKDRGKLEQDKGDRDRERLEKLKAERERIDREMERIARVDKLKAERERIERDIERLNRDKERLEKTKSKLESGNVDIDRSKLISKDSGKDIKKNIDLKSQNTYRIDKNSNEKKFTIPSKNSNGKYLNGDSSHGKPVPKSSKDQAPLKNEMKDKQKALSANGSLKSNNENIRKPSDLGKGGKKPDDRVLQGKSQAGPSKPKMSSFDFDKHIKDIGAKTGGKQNGARHFPPGDIRRKQHPDDRKKAKRRLDSDSEYDSEMDDFIDDGDENLDYSRHIKEIFGYDRSKYRDMDDDDDPTMESSFARQQREEYISKKIGIMEDLEDMKMEAMEKKKAKKKRRISDD
ncbi:protein SPT2 homolog [Ostrinia furnacalis]|uniref:protein SPT2 homolog n=1 Tax=Ostrinia furnacalis TaxID=93504 RepID=UPI0010402BC5|nr:protein SPT2 homolog [Ostrinia furnacalis]